MTLANGVDLITGEFTSMAPGVTIGDAESGMSFSREIKTTFVLDSMLGTIYAKAQFPTIAGRGVCES